MCFYYRNQQSILLTNLKCSGVNRNGKLVTIVADHQHKIFKYYSSLTCDDLL